MIASPSLVEETMNTLRKASRLLLGATLLASCTERNTLTALRHSRGAAFDAAASLTSIVTDPAGDVKNKAPAWLDLTSASVAREGGRFVFVWDLAAPVPSDPAADPAIPTHSDHVCVGDGLDTGPTTAPVGYPFGKNEANILELVVALCWNPTGSFSLETGFVGLLLDRRPLLAGGPATITPVEFRIDGQQVVMAVEAAALGDPASFAWGAFTEVANQADPNDAAWFPDGAPDVGLATWPQ